MPFKKYLVRIIYMDSLIKGKQQVQLGNWS